MKIVQQVEAAEVVVVLVVVGTPAEMGLGYHRLH